MTDARIAGYRTEGDALDAGRRARLDQYTVMQYAGQYIVTVSGMHGAGILCKRGKVLFVRWGFLLPVNPPQELRATDTRHLVSDCERVARKLQFLSDSLRQGTLSLASVRERLFNLLGEVCGNGNAE